LVHKVEEHGEKIADIHNRIITLETSLSNDDNTEKKNHSIWSATAAWVAAVAAIIALLIIKK
jgi:hypothetical protein